MAEQISPFFALIVTALAFFTSAILGKKIKIHPDTSRFESIDGLRGFLALFVFIHHASIWNVFRQKDSWLPPTSSFNNHLGGSSVIFFFMITSFLFVNKILNSPPEGIDWKQMLKSIFLRIVPLYLFVLFFIILIAFYKSDFQLLDSFPNLIKNIGYWLGFGIFGFPAINEFSRTYIVPAGAVWSLPWEWFFYFSLPLIYVLVKRKLINIFVLAISVGVCMVFFLNIGHYFLPFFIGGAIALC